MGISGVLFLQSLSLANVLVAWEAYGVFDLLLPFLLIFAVIFGILASTNILGGNKGINMIIALVIALMALRLEFVSLFFTGVFPRFALLLAALVVGMIAVFLFVPNDESRSWFVGFASVGAIGAVVVVLNTFSEFNYFGSSWWQDNISVVLASAVVVAVILVIINATDPKRRNRSPPPTGPPSFGWFRAETPSVVSGGGK